MGWSDGTCFYHQLGMVAQDRGDLDAAESWYTKSLKIEEELGNRPGMALTYAQYALLAQAKGSPESALDWAVRAVALFDEYPHPSTGTAPKHLKQLAGVLGIQAVEASWRRCTGQELPQYVRDALHTAE